MLSNFNIIKKPLTEMAFIDNPYVISVQKHKACCLKYKLAKRYFKKNISVGRISIEVLKQMLKSKLTYS